MACRKVNSNDELAGERVYCAISIATLNNDMKCAKKWRQMGTMFLRIAKTAWSLSKKCAFSKQLVN